MEFYLMFALTFLLTLKSASGTLDINHVLMDASHRRTEVGDLEFCPDGILKELKANIDIMIEDIGSGCDDREALFDIGQVLQDTVTEVEKGIPRYENERMETNMCPLPLIERLERRFLRETHDFEESDRELARRKKNRRKKNKPAPTRSRNRYRYRGGVNCQRCLNRLNNSDRRLQNSKTCENADVAIFAADMAATAVQNASKAFATLQKIAMECAQLESAADALSNAQSLLKQCKDAQKLARQEAERAQQNCQKTRNENSQSELQRYEQLSATASNDAMNAAKNAKSRYILLRNSLDSNVCSGKVQAYSGTSVTIDQVCKEATTAEVASVLASAATTNAVKEFADLRERALECSNLLRLQTMVTDAKGTLGEIRKAQRLAKNGARKAKAQCARAKEATTGAELRDLMTSAEQASDDALGSAEEARIGYLLLKDSLDGLQGCEIQRSPTDLVAEQKGASNGVQLSDESNEEEPSQVYEDESLYEQTLKDWLVRLARSLYDELPKRLILEYMRATFPPGCTVEGFDVKIRLQVLETSQEMVFWVTEETCGDLF